MATYAIGDVQGCFSALQRLINLIHFDHAHDRLCFVGDLVNRGPDSLRVLRWVKSLGKAAVTVLGNHDLHLLAVDEGIASLRATDTVQEVLVAPDRHELLEWLRSQPLLVMNGDVTMVHAGLLPQWTMPQAAALAAEVERALQGPQCRPLLQHLQLKNGKSHNRWDEELTGLDRLRVITNVLTRLRVCTADGVMDLSYKGPLSHVPKGLIPWFHVPNRKHAAHTIICGHWAALGLRMEDRVLALDSGCVWGGRLTAVRLDDRRIFQVTCEK